MLEKIQMVNTVPESAKFLGIRRHEEDAVREQVRAQQLRLRFSDKGQFTRIGHSCDAVWVQRNSYFT